MKLRWILLVTAFVPSCGTAILDPLQGTTADIDVLAHWTFDEGTGMDVHDVSQNRHDGRLTGGTWVAGRFGGGLFLRRGEHVAVAGFPDATRDWSVSVWVRFAPGDLATSRSPLIGTEMNGGGWEINAPDDNNPPNLSFSFPVMNGGNMAHAHAACCTSPHADTWIHMTAVLNGAARTLNVYNGDVVQGTTTVPALIQPGNVTLSMGTTNTSQFQGTLDEIRIYNRVLNPTEISALNVKP